MAMAPVLVMYESSNKIMSCGSNLVVTLMEKQLLIILGFLLPFRAMDRCSARNGDSSWSSELCRSVAFGSYRTPRKSDIPM
jgi:hypothetical protein